MIIKIVLILILLEVGLLSTFYFNPNKEEWGLNPYSTGSWVAVTEKGKCKAK